MEGISATLTPTGTATPTADSSIGTSRTTPTPTPQPTVVQAAVPPVPPLPPIPPIPADPDDSSSKVKRKNTSVVWVHFDKCKNPDGSIMKPSRSKCKYCPQTYASDTRSNGTSAMRNHLLYQCRKSPIYVANKKQKFLTFDSAESGGDSASKKFDKYWLHLADLNKILIIAVILDPRYKLLYLEFFFPKLQEDQTLQSLMIDEVRDVLHNLYTEYEESDPVAAAALRDVTMPKIESTSVQEQEDSHAANLHQFKLLRQKKDVVVIKNELDKYLLEAAEDPPNSKFHILDWWKENAPRYPILSKIAKDVFAVPASTVASESAFSLGKRVVDPFRASLTPKMVEALVCLSDWLKGGGFDAYKEPTKDEMDLYAVLEKLEIDPAKWNSDDED